MRRLSALLALAPVILFAGCGSSHDVARDVGAVISTVERAELTAGAANLQQWHQEHGTYAGANPGMNGATLVRADSETWGLQPATAHEAGPDGTPAPGPCDQRN